MPAPAGDVGPDVVIGACFGLVAKLSGADGATLWTHDAGRRTAGYGTLLEPAGDVDGDGVTDVAVCVTWLLPTHEDLARRMPHIELLSGADGSVLGVRALVPERVTAFDAAGDLDGDGRPDFAFRTTERSWGEGAGLWWLLSTRDAPERMLADREVLWCIPWEAVDGRARMLAGVRDRASDERSLELVTLEGARRLAEYPAAFGKATAQVAGDFDGDGLQDLLLEDRVGRRLDERRTRLRVLSGASLR